MEDIDLIRNISVIFLILGFVSDFIEKKNGELGRFFIQIGVFGIIFTTLIKLIYPLRFIQLDQLTKIQIHRIEWVWVYFIWFLIIGLWAKINSDKRFAKFIFVFYTWLLCTFLPFPLIDDLGLMSWISQGHIYASFFKTAYCITFVLLSRFLFKTFKTALFEKKPSKNGSGNSKITRSKE